jgi:hypothetical protein
MSQRRPSPISVSPGAVVYVNTGSAGCTSADAAAPAANASTTPSATGIGHQAAADGQNGESVMAGRKADGAAILHGPARPAAGPQPAHSRS